MQYEIILKGKDSEVFSTIIVQNNQELAKVIAREDREILAITKK